MAKAKATPSAATIEMWALDRPKPYEGNPRKISAEAVAKVAASIREFGWQQPIVVDRDGVIIAGHTRLQAAQSLGLESVPVLVASNLTPEQVAAYRIADNRTGEESEWDDGLLAKELAGLVLAGFDLDLTGLDAAELDKLLDAGAGEVAPPEEPEQPQSSSLSERFGAPPFSVLSARGGWWQDRKRAWIALGIKSELGRGEQLIPNGGGMASKDRYTGTYSNAARVGGGCATG